MLSKIIRNIKDDNLIPAIKRKYHIKMRQKNLNNTLVIAGTARSGTTWLAQTINYNNKFRLIYEPFHCKVKYPNRTISESQYINEMNTNEKYVNNLNYILSGRIRNKQADSFNSRLLYNRIMVKMVRGNFLLKWIHNLHPRLKIIYIIRHPLSTVLSQQKRQIRHTLNEILAQKQLVEDYLSEPLEHIHLKDLNEFEKYILYWCINNYVVKEQFQSKGIYFVQYEEIFQNPQTEIKNIFNYLKERYTNKIFDTIKIPSFEADVHTTLKRRDPLNTWKEDLSAKQIDSAVKILEKFNLEAIYNLKIK